MKEYVYIGPPTNLGRFGIVRTPNLLRLTEREAVSVQHDRRFVPLESYKRRKDSPDPVPADDKENNADYVRWLEWGEMPIAELRTRAIGLGVTTNPRLSHKALLTAVLNSLKNRNGS